MPDRVTKHQNSSLSKMAFFVSDAFSAMNKIQEKSEYYSLTAQQERKHIHFK